MSGHTGEERDRRHGTDFPRCPFTCLLSCGPQSKVVNITKCYESKEQSQQSVTSTVWTGTISASDSMDLVIGMCTGGDSLRNWTVLCVIRYQVQVDSVRNKLLDIPAASNAATLGIHRGLFSHQVMEMRGQREENLMFFLYESDMPKIPLPIVKASYPWILNSLHQPEVVS